MPGAGHGRADAVDSGARAVENRGVRRILALFVMLVLWAPSVSMVCTGWEASAADRMDCCRAAHDGCADQMSADACCARTEQGRHQLLTAVPQMPVAQIAASVSFPFDALQHTRQAAAAFERAQRRYPHGPPFLSAVLLI